ncbi:MAG: zinc ribbon domain-containing protein [Micrococcales bacterium]
MKATSLQQQELLNLAQTDLEIARANRKLAALQADEHASAQHQQLSKAAEILLTARHLGDELAGEISRLEQDLALVEARLEQDQARLKTSINPKDIQGIQHEIVSLEKRKSNLEDAELELIEKRELNSADIASATSAREVVQAEIDLLNKQSETETMREKSGLAILQDRRKQHLSQLTEEQTELYAKLQGKTVPVARLEGFTCGACNLNLSGTSIDTIRAVPADELARCPECAAILVR